VIRTQIQLTEEQACKLKALAHERGVSMAELIRRGVDTIILGAEGEEAERERHAVAFFGRNRSGLHDLAERHDEYLADDYQ
jgi:hypothetical protein